MALYPVGPSSYGELAGLTQYVTNAEVAEQVNTLIEESRAVFANGAFLSVNEGNRSRLRQAYLRRKWEAYRAGGPWAALAAALYFSTHDQSRGNALDFGVTNADGSNRSLTMSEHAWLVARGRERGIVWTGGDPTFMSPSELWHFNGYPERATIPPKPVAPEPSKEDDDMIHVLFLKAANGGRGIVGSGYNQAFKSLNERDRVMAPLYRLNKQGEVKITEIDVTVDEFRQQLWATTPDDVDTIKQSQGRVENAVGKILAHFKLKP
jgi:hypothetical protein